MPVDETDRLLVQRIRQGDSQAWEELIARYEGRLLAFVMSRLGKRAVSEDVVQEAFLGFVVSLPNYNDKTPLESYLFAIAAHKLTDTLRREGRRPTIPLMASTETSAPAAEPRANVRMASSIARSGERRSVEEAFLRETLESMIASWKEKGEYERMMCMELLFVLGLPNKEAAQRLRISEQAVANHKHFVVSKLKQAAESSLLRDLNFENLGLS
ncbi:RNA polymerase sigma factor [Symmachiella dynata]|uniref:ECF RNA polymerase sigma-E factor n=1 Tax=Symmachiella dynata TaxID=2527995 RepID=A0A517ZTZ9_9PLAN|nr:RNA polymerase sigma factor [Symmachiella dynata]QDT50224.1 ECF RNA polymerase sigma-E factor [Symmachiella dynata]QDU45952.1 ECF RNA polymerase sigma-E factor [Symmachiella dynata]